MKRFFSVVMLSALAAAAMATVPADSGATDPCTTTNRPGYSVTVCLTAPVGGATMVGDGAVLATTSFTGTSPGVQRFTFYLDGEYLLTDFQLPAVFQLPSAKFVDGSHLIEVEALLRDGFTAPRAGVTVNFANGNATPPVNTNSFTPSTGNAGSPFRVAFLGDGPDGLTDTATVASQLVNRAPNLVAYVGDVYEKGTASEFHNNYETTLGPLRDVTNPAIGNHEFENSVAPGYFDYWDNVPSYYSYDANGWHFIAINSTGQMDGTRIGSAQYDWLLNDLITNAAAPCTVAYFHHPVLSVGPQGGTPRMQDMWQLMVDRGVDVVVTGHDHNYQRWTSLDRDFAPSTNGMTQFVTGGGGHGIQAFVTSDSRMVKGLDSAPSGFGALELQLNSAGAEFQYRSVVGSSLDSGIVPCRGAGTSADGAAPSTPGDVTAVGLSSTRVNVAWSPSTDNVGVDEYTVYRDGVPVGTVDGISQSFVDTGLSASTTYSYEVDAVDLAGNHSGLSAPVSATTGTLENDPPVTFNPVADSYVDSSLPNTNYGSNVALRTDASPDTRSYLRFNVAGLGGGVASAKLRVAAVSSLTAGYEVRSVSNTSWAENSITYSNAPAVGSLLGTSGSAVAGGYNEIDVTGSVVANGAVSFALTPLSSTSLKLNSREAALKPELIVTPTGASNDPPIAGDVEVAGVENTVIDWTPSVTEPNGQPVICSIATTPLHGGATVAPDCSAGTYTPPADFTGGDFFTYSVSDGTLSDTGTVAVAVDPAGQTVSVFNPTADTYVDSSTSTTNYGTSNQLRTDSSPTLRSYLRFNVSGVVGSVTSAKLRIAGASSLTAGYEVRSVADDTWTELGTTYADAPPAGTLLGTSGPVATGVYDEIDITDLINGPGTYNIALTPLSSTSLKLHSREALTPPELIVTTLLSNNQTPTAGDVSVTGDEDTEIAWMPQVSDPDDSGALTCSIATPPLHGSASVTGDCSGGNYIPAANYSGPDSFTYRVSDGEGTDVGTVSITVNEVFDATTTLTPVADSYVDASRATTNYGTRDQLKTDSSPLTRSFLRFDVPCDSNPMVSATLRITPLSSLNAGYEVRSVEDTSWSETGITATNAPAVGALLGTSGSVSSGVLNTIDVTGAVDTLGCGLISVALTPLSSTSLRLASRESATAPELVIVRSGP